LGIAMTMTGSKIEEIPTQIKDKALVARRRRQIVDAAVELFMQKGFHKTTTRQIAKAAGVSIGLLYEYISTKEDILYLVCEAIHVEMHGKLSRRI
jgi:AcrR family transcriptional regulator